MGSTGRYYFVQCRKFVQDPALASVVNCNPSIYDNLQVQIGVMQTQCKANINIINIIQQYNKYKTLAYGEPYPCIQQYNNTTIVQHTIKFANRFDSKIKFPPVTDHRSRQVCAIMATARKLQELVTGAQITIGDGRTWRQQES